MNKQTLIASALAVLGLTACEKELDAEGEFTSSTASQVTNSVLQVTTRGGGDISGWEVPTTAEASMMYDAREAIGNLTAGSYLCHGGTGYRAFKPTDAAFSTSSSNIKASTVLRPVVTITINKE